MNKLKKIQAKIISGYFLTLCTLFYVFIKYINDPIEKLWYKLKL